MLLNICAWAKKYLSTTFNSTNWKEHLKELEQKFVFNETKNLAVCGQHRPDSKSEKRCCECCLLWDAKMKKMI